MKQFAALVVCLAGALAGAAFVTGTEAAANQDTARSALQERLNRARAEIFSRADRNGDVIPELKAILALDPRSAEAHLLLGLAYRGLGEPQFVSEAVAEFRQALELDATLAVARVYLAHAYRDLGRLERARQELEIALTQMPGNPQVLALLGDVERQLENPRKALELTRAALNADPSFAQARYYLALALLDLGQRDDGIRELEAIAQSGAKVVDVHLSLGMAYLDASRVADATEILSQATHLDPAAPAVRIQLARAFRIGGAFDKAEAQLAIASPDRAGSLIAAKQVEFDLLLERGLLELHQRRGENAIAALKKALDIDPNHGPATLHLAEAYLLQGAYAEASDYAARAEKLGAPLAIEKRKLIQDKLRDPKTGRRH